MADLQQVAWDEFSSGATPEDRVLANFRSYELTRSEIAERQRIDNRSASVLEAQAAVHLCRMVLQPRRDEFGRSTPNCVYRGQALERVGVMKKRSDQASASQHTRREACDVEIPPAMPAREFAQWVSRNLLFDQVMCECNDPALGANSGWVPVSLVPRGRGTNRQPLLSYVPGADGKLIYTVGLRATREA